MILKLDPRWPVVWRDPFSVQVGFDPPRVILAGLTPADERMLAALAVGITRDGLTVLAGGSESARDSLLERVRPVLEGPARGASAATVALSGSGRLVELVGTLLGEFGIRVLVASDAFALVDSTPDLAIIVGHGVLAPELHSVWLRRDVTHVPVVITDSAVHVGPIIEPGEGPCLRCLELHRRDRDPAWPAIASQLLSRPPGTTSPTLVAEAAAALCRLVLERLETGASAVQSLRLETTGERGVYSWSEHPDCGCRGIAHLVGASDSFSPGRSGTGSAGAVPGRTPHRPTTGRGVDGPG